MRVAIIGGGALGSLLAAKLAPVADLWLITGWAEHADAIRRMGLTLVDLDGSEARVAVQVSARPVALPLAADLALIAVKSYDTLRAAQTAAQVLAPGGLALTLQNGLGNLEVIAQTLGAARAAQGVTAMGATLLAAGRVRYAGAGPTYLAGSAEQAPHLDALVEIFRAAGLEAARADDVAGLVWGKLVVNAGINALTALLRVPNGVLLQQPATRALMAAAAREAAAVAAAQGIALPFADPVARVEQVARATAVNRSSMLQDVLRQAPTEIEFINGAVARLGERCGVPTPVNQTLTALVVALEATYTQRL